MSKLKAKAKSNKKNADTSIKTKSERRFPDHFEYQWELETWERRLRAEGLSPKDIEKMKRHFYGWYRLGAITIMSQLMERR